MRLRLVIFAFLLPMFALAQNQRLALKTLLAQISQKHDVRFSYIEDELVVYMLASPDENLTLAKKIEYIEAHTQLKFETVSANYYVVSNNRKMDKPLCAYLIDSESGRGIENAQITMQGLSVEVFSNADGYFELPVLAPNTIQIRHLGYENIQIEPQSIYVSDCPKLQLKPVIEELKPVLAHRYIATGITKNDNGTLTVRPGKFGILPGLTEPDVLQTMQQVPGISSIDETVSNINVRGGSHDQNLFLWNGIRMFQTGHFFGLISAFNPMLATNISISKNGSSARYGEGVSALVDVSSHTKKIDSCYNAVSVDLINANFFSKIKLSDKATIQAAGRRTFTDVATTPTFKMYRDRIFDNTEIYDVTGNRKIPIRSKNDFYFYDFSLQYHQKIGTKHEFVLDGIGIRNEVDFTQSRELDTIKNSISQQNFGASFHWRSSWNDLHFSEFQAYGSQYGLDSHSRDFTDGFGQSNRNSIFDLGLRLHHSYAVSDRFDATFGYQYDAINVGNDLRTFDPDFSQSSDETSRTHAVLAEGDYASADAKTKIRAGLRLNYFERFALVLAEPRLVLIRSLTQKLKLEILAERKSQSISQIASHGQDFLGIDNNRWVLANESGVPVQKSTQFSAGLTFEHDGWLVAVDNFYKHVSGINASEQDFRNQFEGVQATGSYRVLGSEFFAQKSFGKFYSWISYTYNDNRYDFDAFAPSRFDNNFAIKHAISCAAIYEWNELRFALGAKWHSGRVTTLPTGIIIDPANPSNSEITFGQPNSRTLKEYVQVNFSASKNWTLAPKTVLSASASVLNILDRKNVINQYYRINEASDSAERVTSYSLGLTPNVALKLIF